MAAFTKNFGQAGLFNDGEEQNPNSQMIEYVVDVLGPQKWGALVVSFGWMMLALALSGTESPKTPRDTPAAYVINVEPEFRREFRA